MLNRSMTRCVVSLGLIVCVANPAQAGMFKTAVRALDIAGFQIVGDKDPVSNNTTVAAAANFQGNTIDFGDFDLTLLGPMTFMGRTGGRKIPTLEVQITSGLLNINPNALFTVDSPQAVVYSMNFDSGTNRTNITGNFLVDARFSINTFGSYDLRLQLSDRQTTTVQGRFSDGSPFNSDFDLGPIDIEGNIFADLLATLTDPLFQATGTENIFALFSGRTGRQAKTQATVDRLRAKVEAGEALTQAEVSTLSSLALMASILGEEVPDLGFLSQAAEGAVAGTAEHSMGARTAMVPEPGTLTLLGSGAVLLVGRRRRRP